MKGNTMQKAQSSMTQNWLSNSLAGLAAIGLLVSSTHLLGADTSGPQTNGTAVTITAGTVFNVAMVFDTNGTPIFPWKHEVRGIVQVSTLGNCLVGFQVNLTNGKDCGGHYLCAAGTMTITTLAGDKLEAQVVGWGDVDPNDPKANPNMFLLYYDTTITGGTGQLAGSSGHGTITGAFAFFGKDKPEASDNVFCSGYDGVATWRFEGQLQTPAKPQLAIRCTTDRNLVVSWPAAETGWQLQHSRKLEATTWSDLASTPQEVDGRKQLILPVPATGDRFYRLRK